MIHTNKKSKKYKAHNLGPTKKQEEKQRREHFARFTDKRIRKNKSIMAHRLTDSQRERAALNFLIKPRYGKQSESLMETIYVILAMKNFVIHPRQNTEVEEKWGAKFRENKEIVDAVVQTIFQWFGTNVGYAEFQELAKILKETQNKPTMNFMKKLPSFS